MWCHFVIAKCGKQRKHFSASQHTMCTSLGMLCICLQHAPKRNDDCIRCSARTFHEEATIVQHIQFAVAVSSTMFLHTRTNHSMSDHEIWPRTRTSKKDERTIWKHFCASMEVSKHGEQSKPSCMYQSMLTGMPVHRAAGHNHSRFHHSNTGLFNRLS